MWGLPAQYGWQGVHHSQTEVFQCSVVRVTAARWRAITVYRMCESPTPSLQRSTRQKLVNIQRKSTSNNFEYIYIYISGEGFLG